jgi:hypothetical protein
MASFRTLFRPSNTRVRFALVQTNKVLLRNKLTVKKALAYILSVSSLAPFNWFRMLMIFCARAEAGRGPEPKKAGKSLMLGGARKCLPPVSPEHDRWHPSSIVRMSGHSFLSSCNSLVLQH